MSIGSPVRESMPGRIDPSDMITAGTLCSRIAASVPTGGLSQATTAITPRTSLPSRCRQNAVVGGLPADQRVPHLGGAVALPVGDPARVVRRDDPHRQVLVGDPAAQFGLDRLDLRRDPGVADAVAEVADDAPDRAVDLVRVLSLQPCRRHRLGVLPRLPRLRVAHGSMVPRPTSCLRTSPTSLPSEVVTGELSRLRSLMMPRSSATGTNGRYVLGPGRMAWSTS